MSRQYNAKIYDKIKGICRAGEDTNLGSRIDVIVEK